jgi:sugar phosphate isomerase/epimerase
LAYRAPESRTLGSAHREDPVRDDQIALQLYTVRGPLGEDLPGTLSAVAAAGYRSVELAGLPPMPAEDVAAALATAGLTPVSSHESLESLRKDEAAVIAKLEALGCTRLVVPSLPGADTTSAEATRRVAAELGGFAARLERRGIRLGYHNHASEFEARDDGTVWEALIGALPPGVDLEIDVYWASVGGREPAQLIAEHADRVRLLHMKDRSAGEPPRDVPPGAGVLDWPGILDAARAAGVEWYIVEQDNPGDALTDIAAGRRHLVGLAA